MSPGWQSSTRQIESSVLKRMARARPFFNTATFAGVKPTAVANSPTDILRRASMTSSSTTMATLLLSAQEVPALQLPDYWLPRPGDEPAPEVRAAFDAVWQRALRGGVSPLVDDALPGPKWQFLCHLADELGLVLHGSGNSNISVFEPRKAEDLREFGNQEAVYAAGDGIWAMFFAVANRSRIPSVMNACVRLVDPAGQISPPLYVFSISRSASPAEAWRQGMVYVLPREPFTVQPPLQFGTYQVLIPQLASPVPVRPLARVMVDPTDFPFLAHVRSHDDARLEEYTRALETGSPWPD